MSAAVRGSGAWGAGQGVAPCSAAPGDDGTVCASDRAGAVRVRVTRAGLPVHVHLDDDLPARCAPQELAARVLRVCSTAAAAAQARLRDELAAAGIEQAALERAGLPCGAEAAGRAAIEGEGMPRSWLVRA